MNHPALEVTDLAIDYRVRRQWRPVVRDLSFQIPAGGSFGLVGESGCGKSTVAMAIVRYLAANGRVGHGQVKVAGTDAYSLNAAELRALRANEIGFVYQNPATALNPSMRVGAQLSEVFALLGHEKDQAMDRARMALAQVRIADPGSVLRRYPHQLSGGMAQRVVIAMALANDPSLLILDEPTTGLDATVEAEVLDLVSALRSEHGSAVLFISHNLGVIRKMCDHVGVLYAGRMAETGPTEQVFRQPRHPYTVGLLRCIPRAGAVKALGQLDTIPGFLPDRAGDAVGCVFAGRCALATDVCHTDAPLAVEVGADRLSWCHHHELAPDLPRQEGTGERLVAAAASHDKPVLLTLANTSKTFSQDGVDIRALRDVNLHIHAGETLGLVGESGSGKTTLAKAIIGMHAPDVGSVLTLMGEPLGPTSRRRTADQIRSIQIVFQNPDSALNPTFAVKRIIGRALTRLEGKRGRAAQGRTVELTRSVQLADHYLEAKPSQLSGGLKQRVAIARAFAGPPRLVVCDEPTSALDVSVQAAILNLLVELQERTDVAYLFISHDLGVVRYISDRIAVLYLGEVVEIGDAADVFEGPHHPYTEALLSAVATLDGDQRERIRLEGEIPSATEVPAGCPFHTRCPRKIGEVCETTRPELAVRGPRRFIRCHLPDAELGRADGSVPVTIVSRV